MTVQKMREPDPDACNIIFPSVENFYKEKDIAAAEKNWPREEVEEFHRAWREATGEGNHQAMREMMTDDGRGGNTVYGVFSDGPEAFLQWLKDAFVPAITNRCPWSVIDRGRIVERWCEYLPGTPPEGGHYEYFGWAEMIYAGDGKIRLFFSTPDVYSLKRCYKRWMDDGQHEVHGHVYPDVLL